MAGIRARNTKPELALRRGLHARGFRFRIHRVDLPGKPDLVFPKHRAALFAHGCFWHGHDCHLFRWPQSRVQFWQAKIDRNGQRDRDVHEALIAGRWRTGVVWECALKGKYRLPLDEVLDRCEAWLLSGADLLEIAGDEARLSV